MSLVARLVIATMLLASPTLAQSATIEQAYRLMYGLQFDAAERALAGLGERDGSDALIPASRAANLLFREFDRLHILQTELFRDNSVFTSRASGRVPDPRVHARFEALLEQAERLAQARLAQAPRDVQALFAVTLVYGLRADYASLLEHRNMAALSHTARATKFANALLAVAPDYYDAYLATGIGAYIVGSLPAPIRWFLRIRGYRGERDAGIRELMLTAERGRLLAPFAKILLAVASVRDGDKARARLLLAGLARDFPSNPLFAQELRRLDGSAN